MANYYTLQSFIEQNADGTWRGGVMMSGMTKDRAEMAAAVFHKIISARMAKDGVNPLIELTAGNA